MHSGRYISTETFLCLKHIDHIEVNLLIIHDYSCLRYRTTHLRSVPKAILFRDISRIVTGRQQEYIFCKRTIYKNTTNTNREKI